MSEKRLKPLGASALRANTEQAKEPTWNLWSLPYLSVFCYCYENYDQKHPREKRIYIISQLTREVSEGTQGRN